MVSDKHKDADSTLLKLTQSCIGPSFGAARRVDQEHARLVGHPGAEEQKEGSQHYPALQERTGHTHTESYPDYNVQNKSR